jgi:hypothetical protein
MLLRLVPRAGLEPARLAAGDFESPASTCFTTWACLATRAHKGCARRKTQIMSENAAPGKLPADYGRSAARWHNAGLRAVGARRASVVAFQEECGDCRISV